MKDSLKEEWENRRGETGYKYKNDIYRPTMRINKDTPITFNELTKDQIIKARKEKQQKEEYIDFNIIMYKGMITGRQQ